MAQAVAFRHPVDGRPLFAYPWEGLTLLGTTDLDHDRPLDETPHISPFEATTMVEAARAAFPGLSLHVGDAVSSYAGVRPVIGSGKKDPSKESREHVIWHERGLWTVTGGKLTTFREIAREAVDKLLLALPRPAMKAEKRGRFAPPPMGARWGELDVLERRRLAGRYGTWTPALVDAARDGELERIPETWFLWAELRHAARVERVVHLEDLMLRRVRAGLILQEGGVEHLPRIRGICQAELGLVGRALGEGRRRLPRVVGAAALTAAGERFGARRRCATRQRASLTPPSPCAAGEVGVRGLTSSRARSSSTRGRPPPRIRRCDS